MAQRKFIIDGGFKTDDASELLANLTMGGTIDMDSNRILNVGTPSASTDATSKSYVDTAVAGVVDAAPGTLDTLNELAAALGDDANFSATITSSLATKATTAYVDGQISATETYADTAEADAVAAAAIDATTKADSAQADAQSYTDARETLINNAWADADTTQTASLEAYADAAETAAINSAAADATSKANAAQAAAEATAASANLSLTSTLQSYADTAEADAISTAAGDATSKANAALASANSYTDGEITTLIGGAPGALDTLNELAAAMTDDANYAATVTSAIATSLQSAKDYADANDANTTYSAGNGLSLSGTTFTMSGAYTGSFTATGDIIAYSDDSLKTNVQVIDGALGKVEAIRGVTFERIADGSVSTGVIAQELKAVLPEAVHTDAEGLHSVAYGNITGLLIEAVKELSAQVAELKK
jgi:predicted HNH restriction endonuclease